MQEREERSKKAFAYWAKMPCMAIALPYDTSPAAFCQAQPVAVDLAGRLHCCSGGALRPLSPAPFTKFSRNSLPFNDLRTR